MVDELKASMQLSEVKTEMVQRIAVWHAHQIRNYLTSVTGFIQLFKETASSKEQGCLDVMSDDVNQVLDFIDEMEFFAGLEQEGQSELLEVTALLREALKGLDTHAHANGVAVHLPSEREPVFVIGVKKHLKLVMFHVLRNALEACSIGECIKVRIETQEDFINIICSDRGAGMTPEQLSKAVEPFYTNKVEGMGLGLFLVSQVVERHKGKLTIKSEPSQGTTVHITLPRYLGNDEIHTGQGAFLTDIPNRSIPDECCDSCTHDR